MTGLEATLLSAAATTMTTDLARQRVLGEKAAAEFVGVSHVTLERIRRAGSGPRHVHLSPRRLGYRLCDLIAWLDARAAA